MHLAGVTVSMRVMSAGEGYRYLLKSIVAGDGSRAVSGPLTRYYSATGTPPGRWLGSGVRELAAVAEGVAIGGLVSEQQLRLLIGEGRHPVSGVPLGHAYRRFPTTPERVAARASALAENLNGTEWEREVARIEEEEANRTSRRAVAAFDFTVSVPKSASVLWAVGGPVARDVVEEAQRAAVGDVVAFLEREVDNTGGSIGRLGRGAAG